jgi:hypothetical protein
MRRQRFNHKITQSVPTRLYPNNQEHNPECSFSSKNNLYAPASLPYSEQFARQSDNAIRAVGINNQLAINIRCSQREP